MLHTSALSTYTNLAVVYLFRTEMPIINGISGEPFTRGCGVVLPVGTSIVDFKYLDESGLLVLCHRKQEPAYVLLRISHLASAFPYTSFRGSQSLRWVDLGSIPDDGNGVCLTYSFFRIGSFNPVQMEVMKESKARGDIPVRVCLLGRDKAHCKVYTLPEARETGVGSLALGESREDNMAG